MRLALFLTVALLAACARPPAAALTPAAPPPPHLVQAAASEDLAPGEEQVSMEIIELMCRPCASQIVGASERIPGITSVHMEVETKTLTLRFDTRYIARDQVIASVDQIVANIQ